MPDTMTADTVRAELLRSADEALRRTAPGLPEGAQALMHRLHAGIATSELATARPEAMAAATASLWSLAEHRPPGQALVRVSASSGARAVAEVVTDDMPFLVDSALAAIAPGGTVHQLLHPVLPMERDAGGHLLSVGGAGAHESLMRIEFSAARGAGDLPAIEQALRRAMADVRVATADHAAMLAMLQQAGTEVGDAGPAWPFLQWLMDDNYVLLGHRRVVIEDSGLHIAAEENLGLLRDPGVLVFDTMRDLGNILPAVRAALVSPEPVAVAKANLRSTVHRPAHGDAIVTRMFGDDGRVVGVRVFYGLFAATAYTRNPRSIPLLSQKVDSILASSGVDPRSHDGRALRQTLDTWPRDELFQAPEAAILHGARRALDLQLRPRAALVVRHDPFERFVSVIAWLPRDVFDTRLRERVGGMLARAYAGRLSAFYIALGDEPLARIHYIIGTSPGQVPPVDATALEAAVAEAARDFRDRLQEALAEAVGEDATARLMARWSTALPPAYRATATAAQGVADVRLAERAVEAGHATMSLSRPSGGASGHLELRLVQPGGALPLADILPLLESLDLRAIQEVPYDLERPDGPMVVLHVFTVQAAVPPDAAVYPALLEALAALLDGRAEADGFNRLIGRAGLTWRECWLLRTMYRWLKQVNLPFSQASVEAALARHPEAARILVDLHHARFAPARPANETGRGGEAGLMERWAALLDSVANPDEDRILSRLMALLRAVLRSGFHADKPYIALKISSADAGEMPLPRPWREVFIHSPRMEGCHLRAGPVARGGIRWSDRREDFRTEVLGLMKAQRLKNVVIVPTGAKGGFVLKQPPAPGDRDALLAEGIACYRLLINGMLDMADTLEGEAVVTPPGTVRRDGDDPYMVAAADKGTATFSDIANGIAVERGFWLGDAFASGGSQGYDHKAMGITARGAWVMIARHFAELGRDIQADPFTCVGVGDMSGDVFGNGLLVSRQTRLLAAFDHRHIILDPNPDPSASYDERARLFALPRSSWGDYDAALISPGGGVFSRSEKRIPLSPEVQAMLGVNVAQAEPAAVMQAILRAPVDLLYFGGIGTYVKASTESQADAGDRANDALRVDGGTLRARVMGEGANLAITQAGRIEFARAGGRLNTDALDNSAGVSTSDHEVNIKILLADAERDGVLTRRQRDDLLAAMTAEVASLVLRDNTQQALAVSLEMRDAAADLPSHAALMVRLETDGLLDRAVAGLPDAAALQARVAAGGALLRPEVAALLPVTKLWLTEAVDEHPLLDDPAFEPMLLAYFPAQLRSGFAPYALRHRLRRDLVATLLVNGVCNRLGPAALGRLATGAAPAAVLRAAWLAAAPFELDALCDAVDAASAPAAVRLDALRALRRLQEELARDLLGSTGLLDEAVAVLRPGVAELTAGAAHAAASSPAAAALRDAGLPPELSAIVAAAPGLAAAPAIVRLSSEAGVPAADAAAAWERVGRVFGIEALRAAVGSLPGQGAFGARAKAALLADMAEAQGRLARAALDGAEPGAAASALAVAREVMQAPDLAGLTVAVRALASLATASYFGAPPPAASDHRGTTAGGV